MQRDEIVAKVLANRKLDGEEKIKEFFNPLHPIDIPSPFDSNPAIQLIKDHIAKNSKIFIYGDYDVDGVSSTAILWETLYADYKNVFPHIPHRESEGYGLSIKGIDHCLAEGAKLIVAVDNGVVAHAQIAYCREKGCDVIVIDHHEPDDRIAEPNVLLHSTITCAACLSWFFCRDYLKNKGESANTEHLAFAALGAVCDLVPLLGLNRSFVKFGLQELNKTERPGLLSLFEMARIKVGDIGTYQVGFMIGPRLNSMGRLEHAIDSLRLLCTRDVLKSKQLAQTLHDTNKQRQVETELSIKHALQDQLPDQGVGIMVSADASYNPGIIGLVASKMVDHYWRPSIAVSIGETQSKGSGRSIPGFDLTEYLRKFQNLFVNLGGHAMACGFTVENSQLDDLKKALSEATFEPEMLIRKKRVDAEIEVADVTYDLVEELEKFEPFGLGNPTPYFQSEAQLTDVKWIGQEAKHLKFKVGDLDAIMFNSPKDLSFKERVNIVYSVEKNVWQGQENLQLMVKEISN